MTVEKRIIHNQTYLDSISRIDASFPYWQELNGKTVLIAGASGMIGSFLIDAVMLRNQKLPREDRCNIIALGRNRRAAGLRFAQWEGTDEYQFVEHDVSQPVTEGGRRPDYIIHAASTTHPRAYSSEPVNTILANVLGTRNLLSLAARSGKCRFLLLSSVEIYGENRGDAEYFDERYCGYLDCNTLRAGYPEGKRVSEALCQAYIQERDVDAVIVRLPRIYGPTMRKEDSKASSQFIQKGAAGEDIVLKSEGTQKYSYLHVADAVEAVLWVLLRGERGEAYNAGDERSDITLRELAAAIADHVKRKVVFELPDESERKGYSTATKGLLDASKLKKLGWKPMYDIHTGVYETIDILRELDVI